MDPTFDMYAMLVLLLVMHEVQVFTRMPSVISSVFTILAGIVIAYVFGWRLALILSIMVRITLF